MSVVERYSEEQLDELPKALPLYEVAAARATPLESTPSRQGALQDLRAAPARPRLPPGLSTAKVNLALGQV